MKMIRGLLKLLGMLVLVVVLAAGALLGYLTLREYKPESVEPLTVSAAARNDAAEIGKMMKIVSFNTGYAGLDRDQDFFMDGGKGVQPPSQRQMEENMAAIVSALAAQKAQVYFLQEVDVDSKRSFYQDQSAYYMHGLSLNMALAYNYRCDFVPFPWPPIGKVNGGVCTLTELMITQATRESLTVPYSWPVRLANLKRCLLTQRVPVKDSDKELVLINLHMDAYDDGSGKAAQTAELMNIIRAEYRNGNYVIAGGDFNQTFEGAAAPQDDNPRHWLPGVLMNSQLPSGARFVFDSSVPSCRSLAAPYTGDRENGEFYIIDGFILTDNIRLNHVETVDLNFRNADHNPVMMQVTLT